MSWKERYESVKKRFEPKAPTAEQMQQRQQRLESMRQRRELEEQYAKLAREERAELHRIRSARMHSIPNRQEYHGYSHGYSQRPVWMGGSLGTGPGDAFGWGQRYGNRQAGARHKRSTLYRLDRQGNYVPIKKKRSDNKIIIIRS